MQYEFHVNIKERFCVLCRKSFKPRSKAHIYCTEKCKVKARIIKSQTPIFKTK